MTDANGNTLTNNTNNTYIDTTGTTQLTISGGGNAGSPLQLSYPVVGQSGGAKTASATIYYKTYSVATNFGCSTGEYAATSVDLVDHIVLATGDTYNFTYEPTPNGSGSTVSGRLASITLATGGKISYSYSGGTNAIECSDGTPSGISRATSDGTKQYQRAGIQGNASAYTTTITDEKNNQTLYHFSVDSQGLYEETHRQVYQGSVSQGTLLEERLDCYNASQQSCDAQSITQPITSLWDTDGYNNGSQLLTKNTYDTAGNLTQSHLVSSGGVSQMTTTNTYSTPNQTTELMSTQVVDGNNNPVSYTAYGYDENTPTATSGLSQHTTPSSNPGNLTSMHVTIDGGTNTAASNTLTTATTYYDTGMPMSTKAVGGFTTTYSYDSTGTFVTGTTLPTPSSGVSMSTTASYDVASGALLSSTGVNSGQTTTVNTYDGLLRPLDTVLPNGGHIKTQWYSPTNPYTTQDLNTSTGQLASVSIGLDTYGRFSRQAVGNGQSSNPWYQNDACYDATGLVSFQPTTYAGTGFGESMQCSGAGTTYTYDALGRVSTVKTPDGTSTYTYNNRAIQIADVSGLQKILQYDTLGRLSGICELSNTPLAGQSPSSCGMDISGTGWVTSYTYNMAGHTTTVAEGAQTRTFVTDGAGRTTSVSEPERGTTSYTYAYNGTGLQTVRTRPRANQTNASTTTATTTQYDALGRVVSIAYSDGTGSRSFGYDTATNWAEASQQTNLKGRLSQTNIGGTSASTIFGYDVSGDVTVTYECTPTGCGNQAWDRSLSYSYDLGGNLTGENDQVAGSITYGRSPAGEATSITQNTYQNTTNPAKLVSSVSNTPFGPGSWSLGNGLSGASGFDTSGRMANSSLCQNSSSPFCSGGTQLWGHSIQYTGARIIQVCDTIQNECANSTYDEMNHLTAMTDVTHNGGDAGSFTYTYDRYGNRLSETSSNTGTMPNYSINPANNRISGFGYDAAGNITSDGTHSYSYDAEGNLLTVDGGSTATYIYDAMNHRISSATTAGKFEYVYDIFGHQTSAWYTTQNFGFLGRIYWGNRQLAWRGANGATWFQHGNYLGTTRLRTDYQGHMAASQQSGPFGEDLNQTTQESGGNQDAAQYTGLDLDSESGTSHAQFRQLSTVQGRWMSPDPYDGSYDLTNPQSLNRYSYVLNNPLAFVDPLGLDTPDGCDSDGGDDDDGSGPCYSGVDQGDQGGNPGDGFGAPSDPGGMNNSPYTLHIISFAFTGPDLNDLTSVWLSSTYSFQFSVPFPFAIEGGAARTVPHNRPSIQAKMHQAAQSLCGGNAAMKVGKSVIGGFAFGFVAGARNGFVTGELFGGELTLGSSGFLGAV